MKIVEACVRFGAPGGAEAHVAALARELAKRGHEVVVHTSDLYTEIPWRRGGEFASPPRGVVVVRHEMRPRIGVLRPIRMRGLREALERSGADVLHAHSHRYQHLRVTAEAGRRTGTPWCVTPHFHPIEESEPAWKHAAAKVLDRIDGARVYRGASRIFTVTDREREFLRAIAPADRMVTIPNGIDLADWAAPDPRAFRDAAKQDRDYVLYAGRLASNKGLGHLLDAFARIASSAPDVDLVLAGRDWGVGDALRAQAAALGIADRVRIVGHLDDAAYRGAIGGCRLLVLPSEWEAFGIVLLEAMACGRPVVATAVGGVPEVVAHGTDGLLVPFGDAGGLAEAVRSLLSDPAWASRLGAAGRAKAARFDWGAIAQRLEAELRAVVERRR